MKILAIDTSCASISASLITEEKILAEIYLNEKNNHATTIMPIIDNLLKMSNIELEDVDYLACSNGPGSFTGLRVGVSTLKGIALALNKKIIVVSTLEVLAYNIFSLDSAVVPMIDAKSNKIFTGIYKNGVNIFEDRIMDIHEILEYLKSNELEPIFLGDGSIKYKREISEIFSCKNIAPINLIMPKASSIGEIAKRHLLEDKFVDYRNLEINYLKRPQAEIELEERKKL